jgi:2-dehydro-3-deoxygalactonokinase
MSKLQPSLIALDWGTTSLRAYLLDANSNTLEKKSAPLGILKIPDQNFDAAFEEICGPWLNNGLKAAPILASGMIGSRQGWREAPYVPCPATIDQISKQLISLRTKNGHALFIVPGINTKNSADVPDVIRGEETQIFGALNSHSSNQLFVLPGTHSKWVQVSDGRIEHFATFMTGEVFAILCEHSILGRTMKGSTDDAENFKRGFEYAMNERVNNAGLLQQLFSARTLALFEQVPAEALHAYLSGLLIGTEIHGALKLFGNENDVKIIAETALAARYQRAFGFIGVSATVADENVTPKGLFRIARAANLLN